MKVIKNAYHMLEGKDWNKKKNVKCKTFDEFHALFSELMPVPRNSHSKGINVTRSQKAVY